jgi:hypothetical protein
MPRFEIRISSPFLPALGLLLTGCIGGTSHDVCGLVLAVNGSVTIAEAHAPARRVDSGSAFCPGSILRTSVTSSAQIACPESTRIQLSEETELELDRLTLRKDGNETGDEVEARQIHCRLPTGLIYLSHQRPWGSAELTIVTPHGTLTANSDCLIRVRVNNKTVRITSAGGTSTFQPADGQPAREVTAGFVCEWPSSEPAPVAAANDAAGQQEIAALFSAEERFNALTLARRSAPPPWGQR